MSAIDRGIGSQGLEQGGPNLGNDHSRPDHGIRDAGDALSTPNTIGLGSGDKGDEALDMDNESSRNLSGDATEDVDDVDVDADFDDEDEDDELIDLDDDDDEDDELDKGL